jgi:hypothetical protein
MTQKDALMSKVYMLLITERDQHPLEAQRIVTEMDEAGTFNGINKSAANRIVEEAQVNA